MTPQDLTQLDPTVQLNLDEFFIMLKALYISVKQGAEPGTALINYDSMFLQLRAFYLYELRKLCVLAAHSAFYRVSFLLHCLFC